MVCDSAFGALLGASMMSFRLFGVAVQRSDALLAAAPMLSRPVAVASRCFRVMFDGPRRFHVQPADADVDRSMSRPLRGPVHDVEALPGDGVFGAAMAWRVRGAGVSWVHPLVLARVSAEEQPLQFSTQRACF
jgi:hypothetical protein